MHDSAEHSLAGLQMTGKANRGLKLLMQMVTRIRIIMIKKNPIQDKTSQVENIFQFQFYVTNN